MEPITTRILLNNIEMSMVGISLLKFFEKNVLELY
jgi:hypothetical protein